MTASPIARRAGLGDSIRHPGHPDQKVHGRRGPQQGALFAEPSGLPTGWSDIEVVGGTYTASRPGARITVSSSYFLHGPPGYTARSDAEVEEICKNTVRTVARAADPILTTYGDDLARGIKGDIEIQVGSLSGTTVGRTTAGGIRGDRRVTVGMTLRPDLFAPSTGTSVTWQGGSDSVSGSMVLGGSAKRMVESVGRGAHNAATAVDPIREVVVHELGHALDFSLSTSAGHDDLLAVSARAQNDLLKQELLPRQSKANNPTPIYDSISGYGKTEWGEAYAESFAEWHMRDVAAPSLAASWYAEHEGWEGAP